MLNFYYDIFMSAAHSLLERAVIWKNCLALLLMRPYDGLGLGTFGYYYQQIRTETETAGWYAHNDLIQLFIELGWPLACFFVGLIGIVCARATRANLISAAVMLDIFIMSMMSFQFYTPVISILTGLTLAYHRCNRSYNALESL